MWLEGLLGLGNVRKIPDGLADIVRVCEMSPFLVVISIGGIGEGGTWVFDLLLSIGCSLDVMRGF